MIGRRTTNRRIGDAFGWLIASLVGWAIYASIILGAYRFALWLAPHVGWDGNKEVFGLLCAGSWVWVYERMETGQRDKRADDRFELLVSRLEDNRIIAPLDGGE